jgi:hypothetical protein
MTNNDVSKIELSNQGEQKRNRLPLRLDEGQPNRRIDDAKRNTGNPCAGANIDHSQPRIPGQHRAEEQRVKEETSTDAGNCSETSQIVSAVPQEKEIGVALEARAFLLAGAPLEEGGKRVEERPKAFAALSGHYDPAQAFLLATRPVVRWAELPRSM